MRRPFITVFNGSVLLRGCYRQSQRRIHALTQGSARVLQSATHTACFRLFRFMKIITAVVQDRKNGQKLAFFVENWLFKHHHVSRIICIEQPFYKKANKRNIEPLIERTVNYSLDLGTSHSVNSFLKPQEKRFVCCFPVKCMNGFKLLGCRIL